MGVTISANSGKATARSIDLGYGGFSNLRHRVAELCGDPWASHYSKLKSRPIFFDSEAEKTFFDEFDAETLRLVDGGKVNVKIVDFCLQSDAEGRIRYGACKQILKVIGDYDDNILYGYAGRPDCARWKDFKAILEDCARLKCDMVWQ